MRLSMRTRRELTQQVARRYQKAARKEKCLILSEFVSSSGYNRSYAATLLRGYGKKHLMHTDKGPLVYQTTKKRRKGGGRPPLYPQPIRDAIEWLWRIFGHKCGKLLVLIIRNNIENLKNEKPLSELNEKELKMIAEVSASTVDRLLKKPRKKLKIKGTSYTRSDTALINQIPIRTFGDWKNVPPGHFQIDCVGHDGGVVSGQCCFTLTAVDVFSGWCERRGLLNRAHKWVIEALDHMRTDCPLSFVEIHPDNGSEFINHALFKYCEKDENPRITRSRPGKKMTIAMLSRKTSMLSVRSLGMPDLLHHRPWGCSMKSIRFRGCCRTMFILFISW